MQNLKTYHKLFLLFSFALLTTYCKAQTKDSVTYNPDKVYYWVGGGAGPGTFTFTEELYATVLINNRLVVSGRYLYGSNLDVFTSHPHKGIEAEEETLLAGVKLSQTSRSSLMILSGISHVRVVDRGAVIGTNPKASFDQNIYAADEVYNGLGIPVCIKVLVAPVNFMAFDFSASANFNKQHNIFAVTLGVALGKIRSSKTIGKK
jgi:hypothetical protein